MYDLFTEVYPNNSYRVNDLESANVIDQMIESGGDGEDWCTPQIVSVGVEAEDGDLSIIGVEDLDLNQKESTTNSDANIKAAEEVAPKAPKKIDDEYLDMEDDSLALDAATEPSAMKAGVESNSIIKSRRYDVSITYDNYYRTPRIWLFGYNENGSPLSTDEIFQVRILHVYSSPSYRNSLF